VAVASATSASTVSDVGAEAFAALKQQYSGRTLVRDLPVEWRVAIAKAAVATDEDLNLLAMEYASAPDSDSDSDAARFVSAEAQTAEEAAEDLQLDEGLGSALYLSLLSTATERARFRQFKAGLMAEAAAEAEEQVHFHLHHTLSFRGFDSCHVMCHVMRCDASM
jgi:hypothetical protein